MIGPTRTKKKAGVTTIDIRADMYSLGLWARKIWQALFREVEAHKFENLDSFLCDLKVFEEKLNKVGIGHPVTFYWKCNPAGCIANTEVYDDDSAETLRLFYPYDDIYEIKVVLDENSRRDRIEIRQIPVTS